MRYSLLCARVCIQRSIKCLETLTEQVHVWVQEDPLPTEDSRNRTGCQTRRTQRPEGEDLMVEWFNGVVSGNLALKMIVWMLALLKSYGALYVNPGKEQIAKIVVWKGMDISDFVDIVILFNNH